MVQQVRDLALSLQWLVLLLWHRFHPWLRELPHAVGVAKNKEKRKKKKKKICGRI